MPTKQFPNNCFFEKFEYFSPWNVFKLSTKKTTDMLFTNPFNIRIVLLKDLLSGDK